MTGRRITVDLTHEAAEEMDRIRKEYGLSVSDVMRSGFTLMRIYLEAEKQKHQMRIVDPKDPTCHTLIVVPRK